MNKFYFGTGDNCNAKQLYYFCKKNKLIYPFTRAYSKGILIDHKLVVTKTNQNSRYGLITTESSLGHIVPGIIFELHKDSDLSVFSDEFETTYVQTYPEDGGEYCLINKRETRNVLDIQKAKLSKGRKKTLRQAIKWRNLEKFESCYESAISNYLYPYLVRHIFMPVPYIGYLAKAFNLNDFNCVDANKGKTEGVLYYSNHLSIKNDLKKFDNMCFDINPDINREVANIETKEGKVMAWTINFDWSSNEV